MLSVKSKNFIDNLRMYLMTSGKNEAEVKELTEELRTHLIESEKHGKNIEEIIDGTPEQYMDTLKAEMETNYFGILRLIPVFLLGVSAYFLMGPAIQNEFSLNIVQVIGFPIATAICLAINVAFLQQAGKKQFSTKRFFFIGMIASSSTIFVYIAILLGSTLFVEPFFVANTLGNGIVVGLCTIIFIGTAIWSKAWFPIWIPALLFIPDVLTRFTDLSIEAILMLNLGSFILIFIFMILSLYFEGKKKRK